MTWLIIILIILMLILSYFLFAPFYLEIDSNKNLYRLRFHRLANAGLHLKDSSLFIDLHIAGWKKQINLLRQKEREKKPSLPKKKRKGWKISFSKIKAVIRSFKIKECYLDVDLENEQWNGILFPFFFWLSRLTGKTFSTNFLNRYEFKLQIKNNLARVAWAFIFS